MQARGFRIVPVNPNTREVFGEKAYPTLTEAAKHEKIDLVNVFRHAEDVPPVMDEAIAIGAPAVWLQLGIRQRGRRSQGAARPGWRWCRTAASWSSIRGSSGASTGI